MFLNIIFYLLHVLIVEVFYNIDDVEKSVFLIELTE
jgi:hypothetical protein